MDPVSHVVLGRMMMALDGKRRLGRGAVAACVIGSLAPDVDAVLMPAGWDIYLLAHQGGTHSLVGSLGCAAVTAGAVRAALPGSRYLPLLAAAGAGCLGHLLLDAGSGGDLRPFWPLSQQRITMPLFAMADPWLLGFFVLSLLAISIAGGSRSRLARLLFAVLAALTLVKAALYTRARILEGRATPPAAIRRAEAVWGSCARWVIYEVRAEVAEAWRVDAVGGDVRLSMQVPRGLNEALVGRSLDFETARNFLAAHDVTIAVMTRAGAEPASVMWSDLRYCGPPVKISPAPWAPPPGLGSASGISCALWFGGEFDTAGRPACAVVRIGRFMQRRPVVR